MPLSVVNCPKAEVIDETVSMVTNLDIPVVRLGLGLGLGPMAMSSTCPLGHFFGPFSSS